MSSVLPQRYAERMHGVLSCYDRILVMGTLPGVCYAEGMTSFLHAKGIRIFDYTQFVEPLRERIRLNAQALAEDSGVQIEFIAKKHIRKEEVVAAVIKTRFDPPGLVHILSAMESCVSYKPWHDKTSGRTYLRGDSGKCLHYYFYFIDAELGLCFLRVPTWAPFRLQFYCNGHSWLARQLSKEGIAFATADNAFLRIENMPRAQEIADSFKPDGLHRALDRYAALCCPVLELFDHGYHWSLMQTEYSTDLMFKSETTLKPLYEQLSRNAVLLVKAPQVMSFLGKKITPQLKEELGSRLSTRIEGTCIKHQVGPVSIKMYDKFERVLRIETTVNDVGFFKHHREVEHKDRPPTRELAAVKKSIYSLIDLREILLSCNARYLEFLGALDDHSDGARKLDRLSRPKNDGQHNVRGLNLFSAMERKLLQTLQRPEFNIRGMQRADLLKYLPELSASAMSRQIKRLRLFGLIKRVTGTYHYYLTKLGRATAAACACITEFVLKPALA